MRHWIASARALLLRGRHFELIDILHSKRDFVKNFIYMILARIDLKVRKALSYSGIDNLQPQTEIYMVNARIFLNGVPAKILHKTSNPARDTSHPLSDFSSAPFLLYTINERLRASLKPRRPRRLAIIVAWWQLGAGHYDDVSASGPHNLIFFSI